MSAKSSINTHHGSTRGHIRYAPRIYSVKDISVQYEGRTENIANRPPDVSASGMFVNTAQRFPEGAVLNLRFRLALSGAEIRTRSEVRYCLPGVGVGVEFVDITPDAVHKIEREVELCHSRGALRARKPSRKKAGAR